MTDHQIKAPTTNNDVDAQTLKPSVNYLAWSGPIVTLVGALSYFLYFVQFANLRDFPWVNLPLVALGLFCSVAGVWRAFSNAGYKFLSRALASVGLLFSLGLGVLFCFYIFSLSYQMPGVEGVSQIADTAPSFSLPDENNKTVQLTDFRGKNLVIAFYRGHW